LSWPSTAPAPPPDKDGAPRSAGVGPVTVAKTCRLLKAIFNTAVDDELVRRNPCRIPGAGTESSPERPTATLDQVFALADAIGPRFRALVRSRHSLAFARARRWPCAAGTST
jgi:hypothetical protein